MGCCFSEPLNKVHSIESSFHESHQKKDWNYEKTEDWGVYFPTANGKHQSPINIESKKTIYDESLVQMPILLNYDQNCFKKIKNNGHTFVISGESSCSIVSASIISEPYVFSQFHMHWGSNDSIGSEHLIDGSSFSAELHFVYWNSSKYLNFQEASKSNNHDGLLVLGVLVIRGEENEEFNKIINYIESIKLSEHSTDLSFNLDMKKFFPDNLSKFWFYLGSLTTPPCTECVKWIVFTNPIQISSEQLNKFRSLHSCNEMSQCCDKNKISANFRPVCKINDRKIFKSYK